MNPRATLAKQKRQAKGRTKNKKKIQPNDDVVNTLFAKNDFETALPILQRYRQENPSDPDVLAKLGWAIWKVKYDFKNAEDYLKLALTFDSKHVLAVEWYAQILVHREERELALKLVQHLLILSPNHQWAQSVLPSLSL